MTNSTKMTNSIALATAIEALSADAKYAEVIEKLTNIKASIDKKNAYKGEKKPTAKQTENEGLKTDILAYLETVDKATITDLIKNVPSLADLSNQKVNAIVRQLKEDNILKREEIKRKAYFSLVSVSDSDTE